MHLFKIETFKALALYDFGKHFLFMFIKLWRRQVLQNGEKVLYVAYVQQIIKRIQQHTQTIWPIFNKQSQKVLEFPFLLSLKIIYRHYLSTIVRMIIFQTVNFINLEAESQIKTMSLVNEVL